MKFREKGVYIVRELNHLMISLYVMMTNCWDEFKESERGDTNFISILLILAVVIVLAGAFWLMSDTLMQSVSTAVTDFLKSIGLTG